MNTRQEAGALLPLLRAFREVCPQGELKRKVEEIAKARRSNHQQNYNTNSPEQAVFNPDAAWASQARAFWEVADPQLRKMLHRRLNLDSSFPDKENPFFDKYIEEAIAGTLVHYDLARSNTEENLIRYLFGVFNRKYSNARRLIVGDIRHNAPYTKRDFYIRSKRGGYCANLDYHPAPHDPIDIDSPETTVQHLRDQYKTMLSQMDGLELMRLYTVLHGVKALNGGLPLTSRQLGGMIGCTATCFRKKQSLVGTYIREYFPDLVDQLQHYEQAYHGDFSSIISLEPVTEELARREREGISIKKPVQPRKKTRASRTAG